MMKVFCYNIIIVTNNDAVILSFMIGIAVA